MMLVPHIFGSALVAFFMIFNSSKQSWRFRSSLIPSRNFSTLAFVTLVFNSATFISSRSHLWITGGIIACGEWEKIHRRFDFIGNAATIWRDDSLDSFDTT